MKFITLWTLPLLVDCCTSHRNALYMNARKNMGKLEQAKNLDDPPFIIKNNYNNFIDNDLYFGSNIKYDKLIKDLHQKYHFKICKMK